MRSGAWVVMAMVLALLAGLLMPAPAVSTVLSANTGLPPCHQAHENKHDDKVVKSSCQCELLRCCPALQTALQLTPPTFERVATRYPWAPQTHPGYAETATPPPRFS